jgi:hypothetical protein
VAPVAAAAAPDGETLAVSDDQAIWLAPRAGGPPRKVVDAVVARMLSFSAEGRALYFVSHRPEGRQAFSVSLDGGTPIPVGEGMAVLATPSPTSGAVVWLGRVKGADGRVPLVFEENGRRRTLATFPDVEGVLGLAFHPEGVKLAVVTAEDVQELDVRDGTLLRRIPAGGDSFMGAVYAGGELVIDRSSYAGDLWVARVE